MTPQKEAMLWGALAGAATVLAETLTLDPASLLKDFDFFVFLGYCVRTMGLMALGAIVVRVNQETNVQKAFQLGVMAPALIVGLQSGATLRTTETELMDIRGQLQTLQKQGSTEGAGLGVNNNIYEFSLINSVHAKDAIPKGEHRDVGVFTRFWYGLTGNVTQGWFVIAGSHKDQGSAENQANTLRRDGWDVKIGEPYAWGGFYSVLIGSYLSRERATAIRDLAIQSGLPKDTYVWRR